MRHVYTYSSHTRTVATCSLTGTDVFVDSVFHNLLSDEQTDVLGAPVNDMRAEGKYVLVGHLKFFFLANKMHRWTNPEGKAET